MGSTEHITSSVKRGAKPIDIRGVLVAYVVAGDEIGMHHLVVGAGIYRRGKRGREQGSAGQRPARGE